MITRNLILLLLSLVYLGAGAQNGSIAGRVTNDKESIPFANVALVGTSFGAVSDDDGKFLIENIPNGKYQFQVSSIGFRSFRKVIEIDGSNIDMGVITLQSDVFGLDEVVVSGTLKESYVTASPVKVEVITDDLLEKTTNPVNLVKALNLINGVQEVVSCGVCYTNNISVNGLPGQYTAILIDGSPIYGNLASVYGLNGIPRQAIDRIEVIKGPNSTLYGSEAMAGVINIITKNPANQPKLAADVRVSSHLETFGNLVWSPEIGKWNGSVGVNYGFMNQYHDDNDDGFGDIVGMDRISAFTKWTMKRKEDRKFQIMARYFYEDRWNGVKDYFVDRNYRELRGNDSIYGESIYTHRGELFGSYQLPTKEYFRFDFSGSYHYQDSYYGSDHYQATQWIGFGNFIWNRLLGKHDLMAGLTFRYQFYDDNTVATLGQSENQYIPGIFIQDEWEIVEQKFTALGGLRLDYYDSHGPVVSPRLNLKWKPAIWTTFRLNFGTGFRVVNLFTEDHAFVTGQREVVIAEELMPEQSYNGTLSFNQIYNLGNSQGSIDIDGFYTYFTNKIIPDYDSDPQQIIYGNTDGNAQSWGVNASISQSFDFPLNIRLGFSYINATETENGATQRIQYAPEYTGNGTISYTWRKARLEFAYTANLYGPMSLPQVFDVDPESGAELPDARPTRSKPFYLDAFQVTYKWNKTNLRFFVGIENIAGYIQPVSPLVAFNDPTSPAGFSPLFDTSYSYSPVHGREFYGGIAWELK